MASNINPWSRVVLVDGDNTGPEQLSCIVVPTDTLIIVDNNAGAAQRWEELLQRSHHSRYQAVEKMPQATDLAMALLAGELAGQHPETRNYPWLICSRDRDFQTLAQCLKHLGVERRVQVTLQCAKAVHTPSVPKKEGLPKAGVWLDCLIQANGGYPFLISQVHQLVKRNSTSHPVVAQKLLEKGKLTVKLKSLGFDFQETYLQGFMSAGVR